MINSGQAYIEVDWFEDPSSKPYLYGVKVRIVQVPEEPEDPGSEDLPQEDDEGGEIEHVHHPHQPVDEHAGPRSIVEGGNSEKHK